MMTKPNISIILIEPQMGENIGAAARVMKNFGISDLRLVRPRDGWPNSKAQAMSVGAIDLIDSARIYENVEESIADLEIVLASTAQRRDMNKPVISSSRLVSFISERYKSWGDRSGLRIGILFGRESSGMTNSEIAFADYIVAIPTTDFSSLNLAQAICVVTYEIFAHSIEEKAGHYEISSSESPEKEALANKKMKENFYTHLFDKLENSNFFRNSNKKAAMELKIRNLFSRINNMSEREINTLHGIVNSLSNT